MILGWVLVVVSVGVIFGGFLTVMATTDGVRVAAVRLAVSLLITAVVFGLVVVMVYGLKLIGVVS